MSESRPKLLLLNGPHVPADVLAGSLDKYFEVLQLDPASALQAIQTEGCDAVLAEAGDFLPLERQMLGQQSSMLLDAIGECVGLFRNDGKTIWANAAYGRLESGVKARLARVAIHAFGYFEQNLAAIMSGQIQNTKRYTITFARGRRHFEVRVWPVIQGVVGGQNGEVTGEQPEGSRGVRLKQIAAVVRDVSTRRKLQLKIDAINRAGQELMHIDTQTVKQMHPAERLALLESRVAKYTKELLHFDHFAVRMINPATRSLDLVMSMNLPEDAKRIRMQVAEAGHGISGYVAATGQTYLCRDASADQLYMMGIDNPGSTLTVPLKLFDQIIGVFNVESKELNAFTDSDRQFAEIFANYLAMGLHILNILLVEKWNTNKDATGQVQVELSAPLDDLAAEAKLLLDEASAGSEQATHIKRILQDVEIMRRRMRAAQRGSRSLLGVQEAIERGRSGEEADRDLIGRRILVVDNEEEITTIVRDVLQAHGCEVVVSLSGGDATQRVESESRVDREGALLLGARPFDLVLSDINLGDMTGYDVFAAAKRSSPHLPVILMTGFGYDPHHSIVRASQEGLQCVLFKPFQAERLLEEVNKAVTGAAPEGG